MNGPGAIAARISARGFRGVRAEIAAHHGRFAPIYQGFLSNHLPMAALARVALGDKPASVTQYLHDYQHRLDPIDQHPGYQAGLQRYLPALQANGISATLEEHLPQLVSGWVRDAYHPLIRIAYGTEFEIAEEVAAGLAYMASVRVGADTRIARLAEAATFTDAPPQSLFALARSWRLEPEPGDTFTASAARVINAEAFAEASLLFADNLEQVSRVALDIFAATHNFFALHLVTASHAFRILRGFAGPNADTIFNMGLVAGYAAIGAPGFEDASDSASGAEKSADTPLLSLCSNDEHDYKLAYTASQQAAHFNDNAYLEVVEHYLRRESPTKFD